MFKSFQLGQWTINVEAGKFFTVTLMVHIEKLHQWAKLGLGPVSILAVRIPELS
jgi:hypothetical protein